MMLLQVDMMATSGMVMAVPLPLLLLLPPQVQLLLHENAALHLVFVQ